MLGLKLSHVSKGGPRLKRRFIIVDHRTEETEPLNTIQAMSLDYPCILLDGIISYVM